MLALYSNVSGRAVSRYYRFQTAMLSHHVDSGRLIAFHVSVTKHVIISLSGVVSLCNIVHFEKTTPDKIRFV